jgi:RNA-splicing ligase RtcB
MLLIKQDALTKAKELLSLINVQKHLQDMGVEVIGSGLDEAPMAYKNIHQVMEFQKDLVEVGSTFRICIYWYGPTALNELHNLF